MRKLSIVLFILFLSISRVYALPPIPPVEQDTNCNRVAYYSIGTICQDSDDKKLYIGTGTGVKQLTQANVVSDCDVAAYYALGTTCQDAEDGKFYVGTGAAIVELSAAAGSFVANSLFDAQTIIIATVDDTPLALTVAEQTVVGRVTGGTINDLAIDSDLSAVSAADDTVPSAKATKAYADLMVPLTTYDANTVLIATLDNTPAAVTLSADVQTFLGYANLAAIKAGLSVDDLITLSGQVDGSTHHGVFTGTTIPDNQNTTQALQALETSVELKAPTTAPTFVTSVGLPATLSSAAAVTWTLKDNDASALSFGATGAVDILKIGTLDVGSVVTIGGTLALGANNLTMTGSVAATANRILKGWFTDIESTNYPTVGGVAVFDQDVSADGNPSFSTANLVGANALSLGTSRTNDGKITFKSGTALNDFIFTIIGGNFAADLGWLLPIAAPGGNHLIGITAATKQIGYVDPASIGALASDCTVGPCLDGSADGGTYVAMYDGDSHWTKLAAGNSIANLTFTFPTAASGGNNYLLNFDADGTGGFTDPASFQAADPTLTSLAAISITTGGLIVGSGADAVTVVDAGAQGKILQMGAASPAWSAATWPTAATSSKIIVGNGTNYVESTPTFPNASATSGKAIVSDGTNWIASTPTFPNASATARKMIVSDGTNWVASTELWPIATTTGNLLTADGTNWTTASTLSGAYTWSGNNIFGDANTDTLSVQSILRGVGRAVTIDDDATSAPTYATGTNSLFVEGQIESATGMYAPFFDSVLTPGNVGYVRIKEDPAHGTNYRSWSVPSTLSQDLTINLPDGNPDANDFLIFGTVAANVTQTSYSTLPELMATVFGTDAGYVITYSGGAWTSAAVTATAAGETGYIQYNTADVLDGEAAFTYTAATDLLSVGSIALGADPADAGAIRLSNATYIMSEADVAGTDISVIGVDSSEIIQIGASGASGVTITPAVILTGGITSTAAAWNLSGGTGTVGVLLGTIDAGGATSFELPNAASPTTNAAGEIAVRSGAGAATGIQFYGNAAPGSILIPGYQIFSPITIKDPVAASDYPYGYTPYAITIRAVHYIDVAGTSWTGQLVICDANYGSCGDTQAADTTAAAGTTTTVTSFSDATVPANVWLGIKTASIIGSPTSITVQMEYTVD